MNCTVECTCSEMIKCDLPDYSVARITCPKCTQFLRVQRQTCKFCTGGIVLTRADTFARGNFMCPYCRRYSDISPWSYAPPASPEPRKSKPTFLVKVFKKLLGQKGVVLAHDKSLKCPDCQTDSIFWEIGDGAKKMCSLCDLQLT